MSGPRLDTEGLASDISAEVRANPDGPLACALRALVAEVAAVTARWQSLPDSILDAAGVSKSDGAEGTPVRMADTFADHPDHPDFQEQWG